MANNKRKLRPRINYRHTLLELSVNRKDPCEVIRELISNSYDAGASIIEIYPLLQYSGFIFFDNGIGISDRQKINGVTPLDAFFSIGLSTKTKGDSIGYKCQGSKLCFASGKFALITRCKDEDESYWRRVIIDNPRDTLDSENENVEVSEDRQPWNTLLNLLHQPDSRTTAILQQLNKDYFDSKFKSGTLILVKYLEVDNFPHYYSTDNDYPYIKSYIRFYTRHGDVRILQPETTGFSSVAAKNFKTCSSSYNDRCHLFLWNCSSKTGNLEEIPIGYPYVIRPEVIPGLEKYVSYSPAQIKQLTNGKFYDRSADTFKFGGFNYCIALAIDGNRRALDYYQDLDRGIYNQYKKSGIEFTSQRGTFICSEGVKICRYNEIFSHGSMQEYAALNDSKAQSHYLLVINGSFNLVTDRNNLSESSLKTLRDPHFIEKIKDFLDRTYNQSKVFQELIERIGNQVSPSKTEVQVKQFNKTKSKIIERDYFYILDIEQLKDKKILVPITGEEHGVGALYTLLSYFVPSESPYAHLWLRPLTFSGQGIDSIAAEYGDNRINKELKGLEYKFLFATDELFNHPLVITDQIICWDIHQSVVPGETVDDGDYVGEINKSEKLQKIGFEIINIESKSGSVHDDKISIICLKKLIDNTFNCQWKKSRYSQKKSGTKSRKR
ncbi:hypothetical protein [Dapis sp. BLCC M172]|uniref:hypothetical protein n=1 Tax=Dapis sp. BLCC M172 TaxID=2975281 RepID=UPI003CEB84A0